MTSDNEDDDNDDEDDGRIIRDEYSTRVVGGLLGQFSHMKKSREKMPQARRENGSELRRHSSLRLNDMDDAAKPDTPELVPLHSGQIKSKVFLENIEILEPMTTSSKREVTVVQNRERKNTIDQSEFPPSRDFDIGATKMETKSRRYKSKSPSRSSNSPTIRKSSSSRSQRVLPARRIATFGKDCICGQGDECKGISSAFSLLNDPRRGFVQLPALVMNPETPFEQDQNNIRAAYLRHLSKESALVDLLKDQSDQIDTNARFVALHHFHPTVVDMHSAKKDTSAPIPRTLLPIDIEYLQLTEQISEADRVRDEFGRIQNMYYCVPCYPLSKTKSDLKKLIRIKRIVKEAKEGSSGTNSMLSSPTISKTPDSIKSPPSSPSTSKTHPSFTPPRDPVDTHDLALPNLKSLTEAQTPSESIASADSLFTPTKAGYPPPILAFDMDKSDHTVGGQKYPAIQTGDPPPIIAFDMDRSDRTFGGQKYPVMLKFESKRRGHFTTELDETITRWQATLETIQAGIFECARVERAILGAVMASQAYGEAMQLIYEDAYVDDDGNLLNSSFAQARVKKVRMQEEYSIDHDQIKAQADGPVKRSAMLHSLIESQCMVAACFAAHGGSVREQVVPELTAYRKVLKEKMRALKVVGDEYIREMKKAEFEVQVTWTDYDSMVGSIIEGDKLVPTIIVESSMRPLENSTHTRNINEGLEIVTEVPHDAQGRNAMARDDATIHSGNSSELDHCESPATNFQLRAVSYGLQASAPANSPTIGRSNSGLTPPSNAGRGGFFRSISERPSMIRSTSERSPQTTEATVDHSNYYSPAAIVSKGFVDLKDTWLKEMMYRSAVNFTSQVWGRCMSEMLDIFEIFQDLEVQRRTILHQAVLEFLPRERRLFLSLPPIMEPITTDLLNLRMYSEFDHDMIEDSIKKRSEQFLKLESKQQSKIMNRSRASVPDLDELLQSLPGEFFDNGLLAHAKVVERRSGLMGHWRTTLLVITADYFLHIFDCMLSMNIERGTLPELAFKELLPSYEIPTSKTHDPKPREDALLKHLTPLASLNLNNSSASNDVIDPQVMDITEIVAGRFRAETTRRFTVRTTGREETSRLVEIINGYTFSRQVLVEEEGEDESPGEVQRQKAEQSDVHYEKAPERPPEQPPEQSTQLPNDGEENEKSIHSRSFVIERFEV